MAAFVSRYARAFADVVTGAKLDTAELDRQLSDFLVTWDGSAELRSFFSNPSISASEKVGFLDKLNLKLGLVKQLRNLLAVLVDHNRIAQVVEVIAAYRAELKERSGIRPVEIVTARVLNEAERSTLEAGASKLAGSRIEANFKQDASILGGAVVRIGSVVYDGSLRGRLTRLKEQLVAGN
jgi:F-type H+-transporting ATPase subunit delta